MYYIKGRKQEGMKAGRQIAKRLAAGPASASVGAAPSARGNAPLITDEQLPVPPIPERPTPPLPANEIVGPNKTSATCKAKQSKTANPNT